MMSPLRLSASCRSALSRAASILSGLGVPPQAGVRGDEDLVGMGMIRFGGAISQKKYLAVGCYAARHGEMSWRAGDGELSELVNL